MDELGFEWDEIFKFVGSFIKVIIIMIVIFDIF